MHGYPGLLLLGTGGNALSTHVVRGGGLAFENVPVSTVTLGNGQVAYFNLGYNDVQAGTSTCVSAAKIEVTPPDDTSFAVVTVTPSIDACNDGTLNVSSVFASTDSAATQTTAP